MTGCYVVLQNIHKHTTDVIIPTVKCKESHKLSLAMQYNNYTHFAYYTPTKTVSGLTTKCQMIVVFFALLL